MTEKVPAQAEDPQRALAYETLRQVTPTAAVLLQRNPGLMTLDGTNTWLLRAPGESTTVVVDPGQTDDEHFQALLTAAGAVAMILLTHGHADHSQAARRLHEQTRAPVRALDPVHRLGGEGLVEGDVVAAAGVELRVWATPGHSSDSLSFLLEPTEGEPSAVLTGDTILGRGSTVVDYPDGDLGDYLVSLRRLQALEGVTVLPGHGPELASAGEAARWYLAHREQRLEQVRKALTELGPQASARAVVETVYVDVDRALWPAAELSVRAQLEYLRR